MTRLVYGALVSAVVLAGCSVTATTEICGDGVIQAPEGCDDGNTISGDGCSATCHVETVNAAHVTANWTIKTVSGTTASCPPGFDTAAVYDQEVDANGAPIGQPIIDLFNCSAGTGVTAALPPAVYQTWVEITNTNNTSKYAQSLSAIVDVTVADKTFSAEILTNGGYFQLAWHLVGATSNNTLTCAQAGAAGGVEAISTDVANSSNTASVIFTCTDQAGVSGGLLAATYTVSVDALNSSMQAIGTAPTLTNKTILAPNKVTNLGTITVPITGL